MEYTPALLLILQKEDWRRKINTPKIFKEWSKELKEQFTHLNIDLMLKILRKISYEFLLNTLLNHHDDFDKYHFQQDFVDKSLAISNHQYNLHNTFRIAIAEIILRRNHKNITYTPTSNVKIVAIDLSTNSEIELYNSKQIFDEEKSKYETKIKEVLDEPDFFQKFVNQSLITPNNNLIPLFDNSKYSIQPWTKGAVKNFIHPSTQPFIKGFTRVPEKKNLPLFQWLATNVEIIDGVAIFTTPVEEDWKDTLQKVLTKFINPFNQLLTLLQKEYHFDYHGLSNRVEDYDNLSINLHKFQVIIKTQEIELTPESPIFDEGSLHLEGTRYEHIIATGIYYLQNDNIEPATLSFYTKLFGGGYNKPYQHFQEGELSYSHIFEKCKQEGGEFYKIGEIKTEEGTCVVFPNFLFHKVGEVKLKDITKIGKRRIVVFWLVSPNLKILTCEKVKQPKICQESGCEIKEIFKIYQELLMIERKYKYCDNYIGAYKYKEKKIEEKIEIEDEHEEEEYSLCEH